MGTSGWSTNESPWADSSDARDDSDVDFSLSFLGEAGLLGAAELFHCAAWEGRVTVVETVLALCDCRATLIRFGLAALWASWLEEPRG